MAKEKEWSKPDPETEDPPIPPTQESLPMKFACLKGFPKSATLRGDTSQRDAQGHPFITYGIVVWPEKVFGRSDVRVIDVPRLPCCTRMQSRCTPEEISELLIKSVYFNSEAPTLVTWEYQQAMDDDMADLTAKHRLEKEEKQKKNMAKFGKRGAVVPA